MERRRRESHTKPPFVVLDAQVLFSPVKVAAALDPAVTGTKSVVEEHHLFPRGYLSKIEITERKQVNQIANYALLEWPDNIKVGSAAPESYAPALDKKLSELDRFHHALPPVWWTMPYEEFGVAARFVQNCTLQPLGA